MPAMTRVGQGVYAASNARRKWLSSDPTGVNLSASKSTVNGLQSNSKTYRSFDNRARAEQLSTALAIGFGSVDVLLPRHLTSRTATVDLAGPSYADRFAQLPDGISAARASVAIAAIWGSIELRRCQENRLSTKSDSVSAPRFQMSARKNAVHQAPNSFLAQAKQKKITPNLGDTSVDLSCSASTTSTINAASGSNQSGKNESSSSMKDAAHMMFEEKHAIEWFECVISSLFATELSSGPLNSTIQILAKLASEASTQEIPIMSIYSSPSLLGACFYRAPSQPNRVTPVLSKQVGSPKLRSVPQAAILALVNARPLHRSGQNTSKDTMEIEKNMDSEDITPSTPIPMKRVSSGASKLEFEMKIPNINTVTTVSQPEKPLSMGYKSRLAAPNLHWNNLMKSLEAKEEEVEEATGFAKKTDVGKSPTPLSSQLIKRKQKFEQRMNSRRRLQTKAQYISGVKRSSSNSGIASGSFRSSTSKTLSTSRRPQRKARVGNPIRDWSSAELSSDGDDLRSPSNGTAVKKLFDRDHGGTTQSSHGTYSSASKRINKESRKRPSLEPKPGGVRKIVTTRVPPVSGWVRKNYSPHLPFSIDEAHDAMDYLNVTKGGIGDSIFQNISSSSKRRMQGNMLTESDWSEESQSLVMAEELKRSLGRGSKLDLLKTAKVDLSVVNKFISATQAKNTRFVASFARGADVTDPSTPVFATSRNVVRTETLSEEDKDLEFGGTEDGNQGKNESMYYRHSKTVVDSGNADDESEETKAAGLQQRVCGNLFDSMTLVDQDKVKRWAKRNFSDFVGTDDIMEVSLNVKSVHCSRCGPLDSITGMCEESIVLKLWKDMTWRKVRRLRHILGSDT